MATTDVLVGSLPLNVGVDIDSFGVQTIVGNYYLRHATASLSLLDEFESLMTTAGVAAAAVTMREDLLIRLASSGTFTVTWSSTTLRDLMGFTANLSGLSLYEASFPSPLLWSPGAIGTPTTIRGKAGYTTPHTTFHSNDDDTAVQTQHFGSGTWQEIDWALIATDRLAVADGSNTGNTFEGFFSNVLQYGYRFMLHQDIEEDLTGSDEINWNDSSAFGPYQLRSPIDPSWYKRFVENADDYGGALGLEMKIVQEYS